MKPPLRHLYRNKETGQVNPKIYNIIDDVVTLNKKHEVKQHFLGQSSTIFEEVEIVHYTKAISPELLKAARHPKDTVLSEADFFNGLLKTLKQYIEDRWNPSKHHLIQHSSGFDSRVMSTLIRQIYLEKGDAWLGDISFVAWGHEVKLAEKIMRKEGWEHEVFHPLPKDDKYFDSALDFNYVWKGLNGAAMYPVNNPDWAFRTLQKRGAIPQDPLDTQVWAASWFNETMKVKASGTCFEEGFFNFYYNNTCSQFGAAYDFEFVQPLLNPSSIEHIVRNQVTMPGSSVHIRGRLVEYLDPELAQIPRLDDKIIEVPQLYHLRAISNYRNSDYGKNRATTFTKSVKYHPWWAQWSIASLCEHLIEAGVKIRT